jgi:GTPase SAR1 family protein
VIFGNKSDLEKEREVTTNEAREFAKSINVPLYETSAKTRTNVEDAFLELVRQVCSF